jgi:hypothetical protein
MAMLSNPAGLAGRADAMLDRLGDVLDLILEALDTRTEQLAVTDVSTDPGLQKDFPTKGAQRWIVHRLSTGGTFAAPTAQTLILASNPNRIGGTIVNAGGTDVRLILTDGKSGAAGHGEIFLRAGGGSWDFRLGPLFWSGSISAIAEGAESKLTVVEI